MAKRRKGNQDSGLPFFPPDLPPVSSPSRPAPHRPATPPREHLTIRQRADRLVHRVRRLTRLTILVVLALLLIVLGAAYLQVHEVAEAVVLREMRANPPLSTPLIGGMNVLLIGIDERPDNPEEGVRSDTLIVAHVDAAGQRVTLLSIPRDTQVELPDLGPTKINMAYGQGYARAEELYGVGTTPHEGGMALTAQTVEQFLGLPARGLRIDYTAQVNFDGFAGIIDALGGITIDVPYFIEDSAYPTPDFGTMYISFEPGVQRMDGQTALIYARTRHYDDDFTRGARQQQVLRAIVDEIQSRPVWERMTLVPVLLASLEGDARGGKPFVTTLPLDRVDVFLGMLLLASGVSADDIGQVQLSPDEVIVSEYGSNLVWDETGVQQLVGRWLGRP